MTDHPTPPALTAAQMTRIADRLAEWNVENHPWQVEEVVTDARALLSALTTAQARIEALEGERDAWQANAAQHCRNEEFWRGLVHQTGAHFGPAAYTADDGSMGDSVLGLKVPELAAALVARIEALEGERDEWDSKCQALQVAIRNLTDTFGQVETERDAAVAGEERAQEIAARIENDYVTLLQAHEPMAEELTEDVQSLTAARTRAEGLEALVVDIALHVKHLPDWAEQRITEALTPAKEEADNTAAVRRENVALREALTFARQHIHDGDALHSCGMDAEDGSYNDGCGPDACWACLTNTALARIDRALAPPPATTGEEPTR